MKSASNLVNSPFKDQFPSVKPTTNQQVQQLYQQTYYRSNLQSQKNLGKKKNNNDNDNSQLSNSKRNKNPATKQSNSHSKYGEQFKNGYMPLSTSQNKFSVQDKQLNLSQQVERNTQPQQVNKSLQSITKKKLAGIVGDDISLPPLGYAPTPNLFLPRQSNPNPPVSQSAQIEPVRNSAALNAKKLSYMMNYNNKANANLTIKKKQEVVKQVNQSFSPVILNREENEIRIDSPLLPLESIPNIEQSRVSSKNVGVVTSYGANTHQGLVRNYNEDRVSIILNMMKPNTKPIDLQWPQCSYFAIYDGHGGAQCAEYLRDNLHYFILRDDNFPMNPKLAIKRGYEKAEKAYLEIADQGRTIEKSGSCAISALIIDQMCYIANVGDSRAILSTDRGNHQNSITTDHKPNNPDEESRIIQLGGQIYQSQIPVQTAQNKIEYITGPYRVLPGRLAVSRTMGDAEAKLPKYNGIPNVISAEPEIFSFKISDEHDFLILACDGIFDKMTTKDVIQSVWNTRQVKNIHEFTGKAIENIMTLSLQRKSFDNVTVVMISFSSMEKYLNSKK